MGVGFSDLGKLTKTRWRISKLNPQGSSRSYYIFAAKKKKKSIEIKAKLFSKSHTGNKLKKQNNLDNLPEQEKYQLLGV